MSARLRFAATTAASVALVASCHHDAPPADSSDATKVAPTTAVIANTDQPSPSTTWRSPALASASAPPPAPASASAPPPAPASASAAPPAPPPGEVDWKNTAKPDLDGPDLEAKAKALFEAIKSDDPKLAADFFFPREPFTPLKDVKDADKYWRQLFRAYENDIHELHRKHAKDWDDAKLVSFALGSPPTWVKPGEEANKIGYYRTFGAKLRYTTHEKERELTVKVIISWQKGWFVTHLLPWKK